MITAFMFVAQTLGVVCPGGIEMIKHFEGFERCPSPDPIGLPTVGYGHLCKQNDPVCKRCFTEPQAAAFLVQDLKTYEDCVEQALGSALARVDPTQYAAMVSFTFNLGCGAFQKSTFLRRIKAGEDPKLFVGQEFSKYVNAGGRPFAGLIRRRNDEAALFNGQGRYASQCGGSAISSPSPFPKTASPKQAAPRPRAPALSSSKAPTEARPSYTNGNSLTSCTASVNNVDVVGTCRPTSQCTGSSLSVPWFCQGSNECCVQVSPEAKSLFLQNKQYLGSSCTARVGNENINGDCRYTSLCATDGQISVPGFCPGPDNIQCCVGPSTKAPKTPNVPSPKAPTAPAPAPKTPAQNNDAVAQRILSLPSKAAAAYQGGSRIGTINVVTIQGKQVETQTAIQYERMRLAAQRDGNSLRIISGFRDMQKQQELYNLYLSGRGNLAARPGFSNHQNGIALDLNPEEGNNYSWLARNAANFGFCRTVPSERWHWEYRPVNKATCIRA